MGTRVQRFAIIGLGRFGQRLEVGLAEAGQEVIAIDTDRKLVEQIRDRVDLAVALDATDEEALSAQDIGAADVAVVSMGDSFEANVLVTRLCKDLGVDRVFSRAVLPIHERVLRRVGADDVINPENESADRWTSRLVTPRFLKQFPLEDGYSIVELATPESWVGKTLAELRPNREFGLHVLAVKAQVDERTMLRLPKADQPLAPGAVLLVMGHVDDLARLPDPEAS